MGMTTDLVPLLLRADADARRGAGHVMRCLALAHAWRARGGYVAFISCRPDPTLRRRMQATGAHVTELDGAHPDNSDLRGTIAALEETLNNSQKIPWMVLDGYNFDCDYHSQVRVAGCRLLVIDDNAHLACYDADMVLNHGIHAPQLDYRHSVGCKLLLGTRYALLRPEFSRVVAAEKLTPQRVSKILVTLGGSDTENITEKVIHALGGIDLTGVEARVIVGPMNPHFAALKAAAAAAHHTVRLETAVQDMAAAMLWADLAVSAAGGTCWELAALGVPTITLVVAENQRQIGAELGRVGAAVNLGWHRQASSERIAAAVNELASSALQREQMKARGKALVDGRGAQRVVEAMVEKIQSRAA
jgi:UDP-2,4-diacetamido-2,4,6-trideoxy-beta-L-altropyranose hydrolase